MRPSRELSTTSFRSCGYPLLVGSKNMQTVTVFGNPRLPLVGSFSVDESSLSISVSARPCVSGSSLGQSHLLSAAPAKAVAKKRTHPATPENNLSVIVDLL